MLPIVGVPATIHQGLAPYRDVCCRAEGFAHVERYVTGLILRPNKTLQGIYDAQVWPGGAQASRRAMPAAVFEAGWDSDRLLPRHRALVVWPKNSYGFVRVVFQEPSKTFTTLHRAFTRWVLVDHRKEQDIALALMIALVMIMLDILR